MFQSSKDQTVRNACTRRHFLLALGAVWAGACSRALVAEGGIPYRVQAGDTLSSIAAQHGLRVDQLIAHNRLSSSSLRPGQEFILPPGARRPVAPSPSPKAPAAPAAAAMVRRAEWGAPAPRDNWQLMGPVRYITLHHTDEYPGMRGLPDAEVVSNICRYHRRLGWADIGYHYLIGRDGRIYEGRRVDRQGAHSGGDNNRNNLGISLIGNFERSLPGAAQLATTQRFLTQQMQLYGLRMQALRGHREWAPTICPGDALFAWLEGFRSGRLS